MSPICPSPPTHYPDEPKFCLNRLCPVPVVLSHGKVELLRRLEVAVTGKFLGQMDRQASLGVRDFLDSCGIEEVRTAYRCPWQNPLVERFVATLRRELLDHVIVLGQRHLERLLREFIEDYYHLARPHQGVLNVCLQ